MTTKITDIDTLQKYFTGIVKRADHHAGQVDEIMFALVGTIILCKDLPPIEVMTHNGDMKNAFWVKISNKRYAFSYNHETYTIEMRENSIKGKVIHSFSNITLLSELVNIFRNL
jgi:Integron cassette protein VCH_CASS1 chain